MSESSLRLHEALIRKALHEIRIGELADAVRTASLAGSKGRLILQQLAVESPADKAIEQLLQNLPQGADASVAHDTTGKVYEERIRPSTFRSGTPLLISTASWTGAATTVLQWIGQQVPTGVYRMNQSYVPVFGIVAIAAQSRRGSNPQCTVEYNRHAPSAQFALAIGLDAVLQGAKSFGARERDRTVPLVRIVERSEVVKVAEEVATLVLPMTASNGVRSTVRYSLIELFRNVVQHSQDSMGGIAAAQLIPAEHGPNHQESIQIAVADAGIGIQKSLEIFHPDVAGDPVSALLKSMRAHISGTFAEGVIGSEENAGLGLFFLTRITMKLGGRFLLASRGAALAVEGDESQGHSTRRQVLPGVDYPGTLVALEIPRTFPASIDSWESLMDSIRSEVNVYKPGKEGTVYWLDFSEPKEVGEAIRVLLSVAVSDFASISQQVRRLVPLVKSGTPVILDFQNIPFITDSMAHEIVVKLVRMAYQGRVKVYVFNATTSVARTLEFVQRYALADLGKPKKWRPSTATRIIPKEPPATGANTC